MKDLEMSELSNAELVARYVDIGIQQGEAIDAGRNDKFNRLFKQMTAIEMELRKRPGDGRHDLLRLFTHAHMQVRLNAAKDTLAVAPVEARFELERIAASGHHPQAGDAGMCISAIDRGIFNPE